MKFSIVIPTYNHCNDLLKPCIDSIIRYTNLDDIELIISANGCTDNTREYLKELENTFNINNLKVVWNDSPLGYPKAINVGVKIAQTDKIVLLNNDIILLEQEKNSWLNRLHQQFIKNPKCGISCVIKDFSNITKKDFAIFFCVMIDKKVFDRIGLLNEEYGVGSSEDIEFCTEAQLAGFDLELAANNTDDQSENFWKGDFPIYHKGEGTVHDKTLVSNWDEIFAQNLIKLSKKYTTMPKSKVAVITPCYNDLKIVNAIQSVKDQTYKNICHYIYDDNSTNDIKNILQSFEQHNHFFIKFANINQGQSNARNFLIDQAIRDGCEFIAFLDSDDTWDNDHIEKSLKHLAEHDITYSTPRFIDNNKTLLAPVNIPVPDFFIGKQLTYNNYIWISSVVARTQCFIENKFDSELDSVEDWDLWIRLWKNKFKFNSNSENTVTYFVKTDGEASKGNQKKELLHRKHNLLSKLMLHLACGHDYQENYINVDLYAPPTAKLDVKFDVKKLPYPDNSVDEIRAFHIIEHFDFFEGNEVLKEWFRVLKPGGRLWLETPDFLETCKEFVKADENFRVQLYGHFFAHPWVPGQTHKFLFTENQLKAQLKWAGFKTVNRLKPASNYVMNHTKHLFLNVEAFK